MASRQADDPGLARDCLLNAGFISDGEKQWVHSRARPFLADGTVKDAA